MFTGEKMKTVKAKITNIYEIEKSKFITIMIPLTNKEKVQEEIDNIKKEALESSITKNNISDEQVEKILKKYGFNSTAEITISKYGDIVADFRKLCK